ncbi:hypothetical protein D6779_06085 [Candidatus Parcubacteria bacterium]|nr:MAG: hypothetical protein D6779_06085 [Candidatus Parcubacteria bacterium]
MKKKLSVAALLVIAIAGLVSLVLRLQLFSKRSAETIPPHRAESSQKNSSRGMQVSIQDLRENARAAARRGAAYVMSYRGLLKDPGILWALHVVNEKYCRDPQIDAALKRRFHKEFDSHPLYYAYERLFDESAVHDFHYGDLKNWEAYFDDIILPALYCDVRRPPEDVVKKIFSMEGKFGYWLTHHFLALLFLRDRGCLKERANEIERDIAAAAEKIRLEERRASLVDDVYAERIAMLLYGGFRRLVDADWIAKLVGRQRASGRWEGGIPGIGIGENPHTTALAVWALADYSRSCPFGERQEQKEEAGR